MLFFQLVLFLGYAYAHAMTRWVRPKTQFIIHGVLLLVALIFLPAIPSDIWKPSNAEQPATRILVLLAATVGLPYFILSTTGPIIQAWFARAFAGRSPYRLYALSNVGSLAALLTFPLIFEPALTLDAMAYLWSGAFVVFVAICGYSAYKSLLRPDRVDDGKVVSTRSREDVNAGFSVTWSRRFLWVLLPAWASLMLLAVTNYVCQDVAVVPLLWVVPLSLYLLSFIISFDHSRWYSRAVYAPLMMILLWLVGGLYQWPDWIGWKVGFVQELMFYFGGLFVLCMVCHGELALLKPPPAQLTEYFLLISFGGALGGTFVSLVAPEVFDTFFEWNIGLAGSFLLACGLTLVAILQSLTRLSAWRKIAIPVGILLSVVGVWQIWGWQAYSTDEVIHRARNFYGMVSVQEHYKNDPLNPNLHHFAFVSGAVKHGRQYADPARRREPIAYFGPHTGIAQAIKFVGQRPKSRVGVVGMGIGTVATYAKQGDYVRMYEINPEVDRIAHNHFTFLSDCEGKCEIVLGDARLALEREEPMHFDLLCLDAFSGDSVPTHLLTTEAFKVYLEHVNSDGILCFNITNSYLDLSGVVEALAQEHGLQTRRIGTIADHEKLYYSTDYILVTNNQSFLETHADQLRAGVHGPGPIVLWTDHFSNIFRILKN